MASTASVPSTASIPSPPPVPFYRTGSGIVGIASGLLTVVSLIVFIISFFVQASDKSVITGFRAAGISGLLIFGLLSFFMTSWGANTISYLKTTGFFGNQASAILVILVSAIAFALVFIPAYTGTTTVTDPYLGALIGVIVGAVILGVIGILAKYSERAKPAEVITHITLILYHFLPYALFVFGPLVDITTQKLQFTPASVVGFSSIFINWITSIFFNKGVTPPIENYACEIPGLAAFTSNLVPQPMMSTLSAVAYIATYVSRVKLSGGFLSPTVSYTPNTQSIWPIWTFYGALYGLHLGVLASQKCLTLGKAVSGLIAPALYGGLFGLLGSEFLEPKATAGGTGSPPILGGTGSTTPTVGTCAAGSSDGEFICESFENGKLKTKVMTE